MSAGGRFPNFFVIGAAKAGTTSLYHYLGQHPEIFMSPVKEPRYFALAGHPLDFHGPGDERLREKTTTTLDAYLRLFTGVRNEPAVGEASVLYIHHPAAAEAIARDVPNAKIIALLRNPVDRAHSGFLYQTRDGYEPLAAFEDALRAEPERIADRWYYGWHYRDQGFYHRSLARYFERFDPSQIRVYLHEDLDRDPHSVLANIFRFLGVDEGFRPDFSMRYNPSGRPRSARAQRLLTRRHPLKEAVKSVIPEQWGHRLIAAVQPANLVRPAVRAETRARLVEGYAEDIRQLERLVGRDLSHWLR